MMRLKARIDILADYVRHKAGTEFDATEETGLVLLRMGWAEKVEPEAEKPKAKPRKQKKEK